MPRFRLGPSVVPRRFLVGLALLGSLALLPQGADAQAACDLVVSTANPSQAHEPSQTRTYDLEASTTNLNGGTVTFASDATGGWTVAAEPITLAGATPGQASRAPASARVTAPAAPASNSTRITLTATLACGGPLGGTATQSVTLNPTIAGPGAPLGPGEGGVGPSPLLLGLGVVVLVAAAAAAMALRGRGLDIRSAEPRRDVPPGGGASFPVTVTNRGRSAVDAVLEVGELPAGWKLVAPPQGWRLEPGQSETVQVLLRSPDDAKPGDAAIVEVRARAAEGKRVAQTELQAFIVDPDRSEAPREPPPVKAPPRKRPAERPDIIVRDEGSAGERRGP